MSSSKGADFQRWVVEQFARTEGFTILIVLVEIGEASVAPLASSYLHVIGDDIAWPDFADLLNRSGKKWDGVALFAHAASKGGPIPDMLAKVRLTEIEERVRADRLTLNEGAFFDRWGRQMVVEEMHS